MEPGLRVVGRTAGIETGQIEIITFGGDGSGCEGSR
jgi:hypothetical protein